MKSPKQQSQFYPEEHVEHEVIARDSYVSHA